VDQLDYTSKIGIITGTGDRRDEDIKAIGEIAAEYFDEIIIRCDKNLRGRTAEEIIALLQSGIQSVKNDIPVQVIPNEEASIVYAYEHAKEGSLITVMCDKVVATLELIKELKSQEEQSFKKLKLTDLSSINS
jgi:cyanophycin synthetase